MPDALRRLNPFTTPETKRFAVLFGIVYFAQGMWYLPNQTITIVLKDTGLSAGLVLAEAEHETADEEPVLVKNGGGGSIVAVR